jgi:heme exporter protein B
MGSVFLAVYQRDLRLALRRRVEALLPVVFFVVAISLFPLGVGPEPQILRQMAAGIVWVSALLATMLSVTSLYAGDHGDGSLEQMLLSGHPGSVIAAAKAAAHWTVTGAPLVLAAPLLGLLLDMSPQALAALLASLLLGTPILSLLGGMGAALTLGLRSAGAEDQGRDRQGHDQQDQQDAGAAQPQCQGRAHAAEQGQDRRAQQQRRQQRRQRLRAHVEQQAEQWRR